MNHKEKLKEYDAKGWVADNMKVRKQFIQQVDDGQSSLEEVQAKLKFIQKTAHSLGLYKREDFFKHRLPDEAMMQERRLRHQKEQIEKSLQDKPEGKVHKI